MFLRSCKDCFDKHHEFHIDFLNILVDIHNENHHYLSHNCLDSCMVEKHKDHLTTANIKTCNSVIILYSYDLHIVDHYIQEDIDK
jgi:hypothetical protein